MANTEKVHTNVKLDSGIVSRGRSGTSAPTLSIRMTAGDMIFEVELTGDQVLRMLSGSVQTVPGTFQTVPDAVWTVTD